LVLVKALFTVYTFFPTQKQKPLQKEVGGLRVVETWLLSLTKAWILTHPDTFSCALAVSHFQMGLRFGG
jgi:hypothetical protein